MRHGAKKNSYGIFRACCEIPKTEWKGYHPGIAFERDNLIGNSKYTFYSLDKAKRSLKKGMVHSRIDEQDNIFIVQEIGICEIVYNEKYSAYVQGDLVSVKKPEEPVQ